MTKQALHKVENFVKVALSEISDLQQKVSALQVKQAEEVLQSNREFEAALKKAAEAMYNSDFINDEDEKMNFVKKAQQDPKYLARMVERVCNAADVSYMGKSSSVKSSTPSDDPVMRRAFGYGGSYSLLDDEN
jgi:predicted urease superfamily metal-dependent hydrolase